MDHTSDVAQFNKILQNRRSTYPYQFERGKHVPDEIILQILENANRAPTHKLTEPWRFTVFTGKGLERFAKMQVETYTKYAGEKFKEKKLKNLEEYPMMSSHVIVISMKRNEEKRIPETEEIIATACAIENMYLTASAYGIGCYLSTAGITYLEESKALFDLAPDDKLIGFFYIGCVEKFHDLLTRRDPVKEKVKWIAL
ncbi:MAG: nitroreductase [Ginsengibacter sp.]